jgi:glycerophosphoryl diester phosphodiesterase
MSPRSRPKTGGQGAGNAAAANPEPGRPLRLAHRGDWRMAPENTLEALVLATGVPGCDGVELDVRLSRDGIPVLLHDATLDRVQGRRGAVAGIDAADLRTFGVPSLADVLAALPADAFVDVELKGEDHGAATADALRKARGKAPRRAVIASFEAPVLVAMGELLPGWMRWLNADDLAPGTLARALELGCRGVAAQWRSVTPARMKAAAAARLDVAAWTVREPRTFVRLGRLGVIACCVEGAALDG